MKSRTATITRLAPALMLALLPVTAAAQGQSPVNQRQTTGVTVPINGQIGTAPGAEPSVPIAGTFTLRRFAQQGQGLVAIGTLAVTFTDAASEASRTIVSQAAVPVDQRQITANCPVLHLGLGPLEPTLLELPVHIDQMVLDVTAASGGTQLGTLICSVASQMNGSAGATGSDTGLGAGANTGSGSAAPAGQIVDLLNQILVELGQ